MSTIETSRGAQRIKSNREELIERIARTVTEDGAKEVFPGFFLARSSKPSQSLNTVYEPAFCFIAQGRKRALLGEEVFRYDPGHYLLFTVDLPLIFQIEKATQDEPYLGLRLDLDPSLVAGIRFLKFLRTPLTSQSIIWRQEILRDANLFESRVLPIGLMMALTIDTLHLR